jgi:hypothetical protein
MRFFPKSILILLLYFLYAPVYCQVKLGLGLSVMPQWNYMTYVQSYAQMYDGNDNSYFVFGGGLHADLQLRKWLGIETGIYYAPRGMIVRNSPLSKLRLNYYNIPCNIKFSIPVGSKVTLDYLVGFNFLRLRDVTYLNEKLIGLGNFEKSVTNFMIGHGITVHIDNDLSFFSNFRFDISVTEVEKFKMDVPGFELGDSQHLGIAFNMGFKINISLTAPSVTKKPKKKEKKVEEDKLRQASPRYRKN